MDAAGNLKVSDFGLSALSQQIRVNFSMQNSLITDTVLLHFHNIHLLTLESPCLVIKLNGFAFFLLHSSHVISYISNITTLSDVLTLVLFSKYDVIVQSSNILSILSSRQNLLCVKSLSFLFKSVISIL